MRLNKDTREIINNIESLNRALNPFNHPYFKNMTPSEIARLARSTLTLQFELSNLYLAIIEIQKTLPLRNDIGVAEMQRKISYCYKICQKNNPFCDI